MADQDPSNKMSVWHGKQSPALARAERAEQQARKAAKSNPPLSSGNNGTR